MSDQSYVSASGGDGFAVGDVEGIEGFEDLASEDEDMPF